MYAFIAVLDESKKIVYILFGYQELRSLANTFNTVLAINVTDSKSVSFIDTTQNLFTAAEQPTPATGDKETASQTPSLGNDDSSIVGGAVGGSLGVRSDKINSRYRAIDIFRYRAYC